MRLRQLGVSQSTVFFAPPEVHQSILNVRGKTMKDFIDSSDVIIWLLEQTCCNIEQFQPLYISQGLQYCRQRLSMQQNPNVTSETEERKTYVKTLEQPEQYSLEQLYSPNQKAKARLIDACGFSEIVNYVKQLNVMKKELRDRGHIVQALLHQEVEQEREVAVEIEVVREMEKPHHAIGLSQPNLHREIRSFAETGRLVASSQTCQQAFITLRQTALGQRLGISENATKSKIFVTQDFSNTVVTEWRKPLDQYSRPVHWILWSILSDTALIISDFEADTLLAPTGPFRGAQESPRTHLIAYAAPVTRPMMIFDTLKFYTLPKLPETWCPPTWLLRDLGLFAGRLYFDFDSQYPVVCEALGLDPPVHSGSSESPAAMTEEELWSEVPFAGSEVIEKGIGVPAPSEPFSTKPLLFMQEWLSIRRKGQDFSSTMMGELCQGRSLERRDWEKDGRQVEEEEGESDRDGGEKEEEEGEDELV